MPNCLPSALLRATLSLVVLACGGKSATPAPEDAAVTLSGEASALSKVPPGTQVHLSIDDLPYQLPSDQPLPLDRDALRALSDAILETFSAEGVQTSVFANCHRLEAGDSILEAWESAGHRVGNHTHTHAALHQLGAAAWLEDVSRCHAVLLDRLEEPPQWFRYPYLSHGRDPEEQEAARAGLTALGYRNVPVTVATTEWLYAFVYREALAAGDEPRARAIAADYHRHMDESLAEGVAMAMEVPGRPLPQVVLLHLNELLAEELGSLLQRWREHGIEWVDLDRAMKDPVFQQQSHYSGQGGLSWLSRIRSEGDPQRPYWFGMEQARVAERWTPSPEETPSPRE